MTDTTLADAIRRSHYERCQATEHGRLDITSMGRERTYLCQWCGVTYYDKRIEENVPEATDG